MERMMNNIFPIIFSFVEKNRGNNLFDNKIIDFIIKSFQEVLLVISSMGSIERIFFFSLYFIPIPFMVEGYLAFKKFLFPRMKKFLGDWDLFVILAIFLFFKKIKLSRIK